MATESLMVRIGANIKDFEKKMSQMQTKMDSIGKGMRDVGGKMSAGFTLPVVAAIGMSIKSFADLEQAVGGIETLFKDSSDAVIKNSETAYKRAGVSGVSYMENVTSFSATLLQGLGGDTEKAAGYADKAMVDMSDNANKFGTSVESVQDSYQGFAKGNFTMLDNLKLGFGGTAGEMARLINESGVLGDTMDVTAESVKDVPFHTMIEAIHEVQSEMGVTGTTVKEAEETVAGSFGMMKSSFADLAAGFGQEGANIEGLFDNLWESVGSFGENIKRVLGDMWDNLPIAEWQKWLGVIAVAAGPVLVVLGGLVSMIASIVTVMTPVIAAVAKAGGVFKLLGTFLAPIAKFFGLFKPLLLALTGPVGLVVAGIVALGAGFVLAYNKSETFRNFIDGIKEKFGQAIGWITDFKDGIVGLFQGEGTEGVDILKSIGLSDSMVDTLFNISGYFLEFYHTIVGIVEDVKTAFSGIVEIFKGNHIEAAEMLSSIGLSEETIDMIFKSVALIKDGFNTLVEGVKTALSTVGEFFKGVFNSIAEWWDSNGQTIINTVVTAFEWMKETLGLVFDLVVSVVKLAFRIIQETFQSFAPIVTGIWNTLWDIIKGTIDIVMPIITGIISTAMNIITEAFRIFAPIVEGIWNTLWPVLEVHLTNIWETMKTVVQIGMDFIQGLIKTVTAIIDGDWALAWETIKEFTSTTFERIKELFSGMTERAKELVLGMVESVKQWFSDMWLNVTTKVTEIKDSVTEKFEMLKAAVQLKIKNMVVDVITKFFELKNDVSNKVTEMKDSVTEKFEMLKAAVQLKIKNMVFSVVSKFLELKNNISTKATEIKDAVTNKFTELKDNAINRVTGMYNSVTSWFGDMKTNVTNKATELKDGVVNKFTGMKDGAIDGVQKLYDGASGLFDDVKSYASDTFDNMVTGAKELPGRIGNAIKNAASFAVDGVKSLGNKMGSKLGEVVNGVTGGLNGILEKIGISDLIPNISIPTFSTGTQNGRIANDMLGMVNDRGPGNGRGGATQELIKRDGQMFAPRGRNAIVPLKKGDEIFNGAQTQSMIASGAIPRFSQGTGTEGGDSGRKGIFSTLKDVVSNVWDVIQDPGAAFSALMDSVTANFDGMDGFAGKMLSGGWSMLTDGIKNFITKIFKENEGALGSGKAGSWMSYPITAGYSPGSALSGYPSGFNGGKHYGIDYGTPSGTPITAPTSGSLSSFMNTGGGLIAKLVTGELRQFFMHMQSVQPNGSVAAGDVIGKSGNSGKWTTGPHVHWQAQQGTDILNTGTIDPRKVVGHANGGIFRNNHIAEINEEGPEAIIPLSAKRRGRANSLYNSVGKAIGADDGSKEMIRNQQIQIDRLDTAINVLLGIEDKTGITESDIGRANDKYNARQTSKRGATTGRLNYV